MEIVKSVVPPAPMALEEKLFEIVGLDGATVSASDDVQVWFAQEGEELVLVTLSGGEMIAVLVTPVWAYAPNAVKKHKNDNVPVATKLLNRKAECNIKKKEQKALNECKKVTF